MDKPVHLYPSDIAARLEFDFVLEQLSGYCRGELGRTFLQKNTFSSDAEKLRVVLQSVNEVRLLLEDKPQFLQTSNEDIADLLQLLDIENAALSIYQFLKLIKLLMAADEVFNLFIAKGNREKYPVLADLIDSYEAQPAILKGILHIIDIEKEIVKESSSPELGRIRREMMARQRELMSLFRQVMGKYRKNGWLADQEESSRNSRRVLAVMAEYKRSVPGILLDESESGKVVFIEPLEISQFSNELVDLQLEERREIERILRELTTEVRPYVGHVRDYMDMIGRLDLLIAKAIFAEKYQCTVPAINEKGILMLKGARHPVLSYWHKKSKKTVVPMDLELQPEARILVISGPNAGGKSIALKTVGLLQMMVQFGMMIPAEEGSSFCLFHHIMVDVGDQQSIENDMSTYSSHLKNMQYFIAQADEKSLILTDEMGAGTDPALGGPMAVAILETLLEKGVYGIITTHYSDLKNYAMSHPGIQNAAMAFDKKSLMPLYQLFIGRPGSSYTFEIAQKSGLHSGVIALARKKAGENQQLTDESLSDIQHEKQFLKGLRKNIQDKEGRLDELKLHYERLKKELEKEKKKLLKQYEERQLETYNQASRELENLMRAWKENKADKEKFIEIRKNIDQNRETKERDIAALDNEPVILTGDGLLQVGSTVKLEEGTETGIITEIRNKEALVQFGAIVTKVKLQKLQMIAEQTQAKKPVHPSQQVNRLEEKSQFDFNLDIRGMYADEAIQAFEQFMDKAILFSMGKVRIIHGIGTGRLRQAVRQYIKGHPHIASFNSEPQSQGGEGVTVIELL